MPNRILREGILTSPRMAKLGWAEEVFYRRLISVVDDFGRYYADPGLLRAACYPRLLSKVSDPDITKWLQVIAAAALVRVYSVGGEGYLEVLDFDQQVRAKKSKFPDMIGACIADAEQTPANEHLGVFVSGDVVVEEKAPRASRLPAPFVLDPAWREWAVAERPDLDPDLTAAKFADYWHSKPGKDGRKLNWLMTWRNWVREERVPKTNPADVARVTVPSKPTNGYLSRLAAEPARTPEERMSDEAARIAAVEKAKAAVRGKMVA